MKYDIEKVKSIFITNGLILDSVDYKNTQTKLECHDSYGFKYETTVGSLFAGKKPNKYSKYNKFTIENIQMVLDKETDGVKILSKEYINNRQKILFLCSCGKEYQMNVLSFVSGKKRYCNYCAKSKRYDGLSDYTMEIKNKCQEINCTLLTHERIVRTNQVFEYICNKHKDSGILTSSYDKFMSRKTGCKLCGIISRGEKHRTPIDNIKSLLIEKGFTYVNHDYVRYGNGSNKIRIHCLCNNHKNKGIQYISYDNLKNNKKGCIYCIGRGRTKDSLQSECDILCNNVTIVDFNSYVDVIAKCNKCGYEWRTKGVNLTQGHSCPHCNMSSYEKKIESILKNNNIVYRTQYKIADCKDISHLPFDFYLPDYNAVIEVDGQGHFKPTNFRGISDEKAIITYSITQKHDKIKDSFCKSHNISMIRLPYYILDDKSIDNEKYVLERINKIPL